MRSAEEAREKGRNGGKASGEARRRKRALRDNMEMLLAAPVSDMNALKEANLMGFEPDEIDNSVLPVVALFKAAKAGDVAAFKELRNLIGEETTPEEPAAEGVPFYMDAINIADGFAPIRRDVLEHRHREYMIGGGRGATRSSFVSLMVVELLMRNEDAHALILRQVGNTLRDSVHAQMKWAIEQLGLTDQFTIHKSPLEIIRNSTGQIIYFRGADEPTKIKSIKPPFGSIRILWFEEYDQFPGERAIRVIEQSALRGETDDPEDAAGWVFKTFNTPRNKSHWVNKQAAVKAAFRLCKFFSYKKAMVPKEWLGPTFIELAEHLRKTDPDSYRHEYLGEAVGNGGMVFENVVSRTVTDEDIAGYDRVYNGVDWGWYPDPFAFVRCAHFPAQKRLLIFDEIRCNKKSNAQTAKMVLERIDPDEIVVCDSAEPKSVEDYRAEGVKSRKADKGPGSLEYSIKWLQSMAEIVIDPERCPHTYKEFIEYERLKDKDGEYVNQFPDANNHFIDATRYALERVWKRRGQ